MDPNGSTEQSNVWYNPASPCNGKGHSAQLNKQNMTLEMNLQSMEKKHSSLSNTTHGVLDDTCVYLTQAGARLVVLGVASEARLPEGAWRVLYSATQS